MQIATKNLIYNHQNMKNIDELRAFFSEHVHPIYEVIFFEKGDAHYVIEGNSYTLKPFDLVFTKPLTYHFIDMKSNAEYQRFDIQFDESFVGKEVLDKLPKNIDVINCANNSIIMENFKRMRYYEKYLTEEEFVPILKNLVTEIFVNLRIDTNYLVNRPFELSPIITKALDYINDHLFSKNSIGEICQFLGLSEPYFFKLFKSQLKISPKQYINTKRIHAAKQLILSGKRPTEIFALCGFDSYVGFYKQYVKIFGYPPSDEGKD